MSGVAAADRFDASPDLLASFVFLQVAVYLAMQTPAGLLLDRWRSRALISAGSLAMAPGQALLAVPSSLELVYVARFVVGTGDALVFVSALALLPRWFPVRRVPVLTQLTSTLGQTGQILSALPFLAMLRAAGWTATYTAAAAPGTLLAVLALVAAGTPRTAGPNSFPPARPVRSHSSWPAYGAGPAHGWPSMVSGRPVVVEEVPVHAHPDPRSVGDRHPAVDEVDGRVHEAASERVVGGVLLEHGLGLPP